MGLNAHFDKEVEPAYINHNPNLTNGIRYYLKGVTSGQNSHLFVYSSYSMN